MIEAIFLNPLSKSQMKPGRKGHTIRSKTLKSWQSVVKKHGGDMKAAAREWKSRSRAGSSKRRGAAANSRRVSVKGLSGLAARRAASSSKRAKGGVPMAARKRRRNQLPPTQAWIEKWRAGMVRAGRTPKKGPKFKKISGDPRLGQKQWKGRYKRKLRGAVYAHARARKSPAARTFARKVSRGLAQSTIVNPVTYEQWRSRFMRGTSYAPYRKTTPTGRRSKRKRGPKPGTRAWGRSVVRGVKRKGQRRYARGISKAGLPEKWKKSLIGAMKEAFPRLRANPRRGKKRGRRSSMKRYNMVRASNARAMMLSLMPKKRRKSRRKSRRSYRRMKNPVADSLKAMVSQPSLMKYLYVTGGVAVGGVFPSIISRYIWKGEKSQMTESALGIVGSALAGLGVATLTKDDQNGVLVAAGGIAGVIGNLVINQLNKALGFSGLGQAAEDALQAAVEAEMERAGLTGMGQFLLPSTAEELPTPMSGMGQFLTEPELQTDVTQTEGFGVIGRDDLVDSGSAAFAGIDGSVF